MEVNMTKLTLLIISGICLPICSCFCQQNKGDSIANKGSLEIRQMSGIGNELGVIRPSTSIPSKYKPISPSCIVPLNPIYRKLNPSDTIAIKK